MGSAFLVVIFLNQPQCNKSPALQGPGRRFIEIDVQLRPLDLGLDRPPRRAVVRPAAVVASAAARDVSDEVVARRDGRHDCERGERGVVVVERAVAVALALAAAVALLLRHLLLVLVRQLAMVAAARLLLVVLLSEAISLRLARQLVATRGGDSWPRLAAASRRVCARDARACHHRARPRRKSPPSGENHHLPAKTATLRQRFVSRKTGTTMK